MKVLRQLGSLVLGDTWEVPAGVAAVVGLAALLPPGLAAAELPLGAAGVLLLATRR